MISKIRLGIVCLGFISTDFVFAGTIVPEMDVAGVPVVLGLTITLILVLKDRFTK
jgi:hypothetical protein